jgi:hypothetical protein
MAHLIVDIDGTLANCEHRLHHIQKSPKNWDAFYAAAYADEPIKPICSLVWSLYSGRLFDGVIYVTGRPRRIQGTTLEWLVRNQLPDPRHATNGLEMRGDTDFRPDFVVKREILHKLRALDFNPTMAIEDRSQVCRMWREEGLTCLQVAEGEF